LIVKGLFIIYAKKTSIIVFPVYFSVVISAIFYILGVNVYTLHVPFLLFFIFLATGPS